MANVATITIAMLTGQVATPLIVCGVTTAPSRMPITTKQTRASGAGTLTGRRSNAAAATASTDPQINPAGKPTRVNATPPASAMTSVSAVARSVRGVGMGGGIGLPHARCGLRRQTSMAPQ